jgi:hypothetical protein
MKTNIEKMIADMGKVTNADLQAALAKAQAKEAEKVQAVLLDQMGKIQSSLDSAISNLRSIRKVEKEAKAFVTKLANAQAEFFKDGDYAKFRKSAGFLF